VQFFNFTGMRHTEPICLNGGCQTHWYISILLYTVMKNAKQFETKILYM